MPQKPLVFQSLWAMERRRRDGVEWSLSEKPAMIRDDGSVYDQAHGRALRRLSAPTALLVRAKLCRIDPQPRVFGAGRVAVAPVGELPSVRYRLDALPSYDLNFFAAYTGFCVAPLTRAADGSGYEIA
jgi:hypothetical protein